MFLSATCFNSRNRFTFSCLPQITAPPESIFSPFLSRALSVLQRRTRSVRSFARGTRISQPRNNALRIFVETNIFRPYFLTSICSMIRCFSYLIGKNLLVTVENLLCVSKAKKLNLIFNRNIFLLIIEFRITYCAPYTSFTKIIQIY